MINFRLSSSVQTENGDTLSAKIYEQINVSNFLSIVESSFNWSGEPE